MLNTQEPFLAAEQAYRLERAQHSYSVSSDRRHRSHRGHGRLWPTHRPHAA